MSAPAIPGRRTVGDPELTLRQRAVFASLVSLHGQLARPVGSDRIAHTGDLGLSSASIRGALAELEGMGLLERSHAASGRVPSLRGYEHYVRALLEPAVLPTEVVDEVQERLSRSRHDVESMLHEASRLMASLTGQLGLALATTLDDERLEALDLEPLSDRRALMVLGLGGAAARTLLLEFDVSLDRASLVEVQSVLRERLLDRPLGEVRLRLGADPELVRHSATRIVARAAIAHWTAPVATPLLAAGAMHMAEQPEFADAHQLGSLLEVVESGAPLDRLLVLGIEGQVGARVGVPESDVLAACSLVSFRLPGAVPGAVGVLGPVRMNYAFTFAVVDAVGQRVAELLSA